jgi:hypothetical protein
VPSKSKNKGSRYELEVVRLFQEFGLAAEKVPLSGALGGKYTADVTVPLWGRDKRIECKRRAGGFKTIYGWLADNFALVMRDDHCPSLAVVRLEDLARLMQIAELAKSTETSSGLPWWLAEEEQGN